ncbi:ABC transporter transmembrane domain-containing protein [Corynebacterium accolens]|uniref:ABC transporter transmembrane domain-containing protein n=1 Tax=Corynebacterium accolens TaxID=38284 RepID=UPI00254A19BB|nr:ABC transporter ATP-binding protein [Corynebacterium accolens]MDK8680409.1 ABC transporter ATP-binding protein [Corynebacterium accolens]
MATLPEPSDRRWLLKTVFSRPGMTIPAAVCMAISFVLNGTTPVIVGHAIDEAVVEGSIGRLWWWLALLVLAFAVNAITGWCGRGLNARSMLVIGHDVRMAITDRILDPKGMGGPKRTPGELLAIASTDATRVQNAVMMTVFPVAEITSIIYVAVMTSRVNVVLGVAILCGGPIVVWGSLRAARPLRKRSGIRQAALGRASATATDIVHGLRIIKGIGAIDTVRKRYAGDSDAAYERTVEANAAQAGLNASTEALGSIYVIAVAVAAGYLALDGQMSIGELIMVIGLTQFIITPMTMLGRNIASRWAAAQASAQRIVGLLGAPGLPGDAGPQVPALRPGITAIDGHAPEGLRHLPREKFIVVPHEVMLFTGTVQDNIHPDAGIAARALEVAAGEDIPGGVDREVGEHGNNLSGGQQQRIALARAIAADPEVLILSDPTTAVDSVTEQEVAHRVAAYRKDKPTIVYTSAPAWHAVGVES